MEQDRICGINPGLLKVNAERILFSDDGLRYLSKKYTGEAMEQAIQSYTRTEPIDYNGISPEGGDVVLFFLRKDFFLSLLLPIT